MAAYFFFLSYSDLFIRNLCRCRGLLLQLILLNDTQTQQDSSGRGIGPSQILIRKHVT